MLLFLAIFMLTACGTTEEITEVDPVEQSTEVIQVDMGIEDFSCHTIDAQGEVIQGYHRPEDGNWYLFVPSTQQISELEIYYEGDITEVSSGNLNKEALTISSAFADGTESIEVKSEDGDSSTIVAMQSDLPSLQIYLNDTTLDIIHQDKDKKYKDNTVILTDPEETYSFSEENSVEIKGRGNSSWREFDKKGYQIKFSEKKDVFGMGEAKKWVLIPNASDDSLMRNQLAFQLAAEMDMAFVPEMKYVDLWIDGDYLGTYMLGEKVELGSSRLNLTNEAGALFEHDEDFYTEEDYWFYNEEIQRHFTLKEIDSEDTAVIEAAIESFNTSLTEWMMYLYSLRPKDATLEALSEKIDVDSFAKYYLINDYVMNIESFGTSFYWYQDGPDDVLHLGPIWDYDTCMGNDGFPADGNYGYQHIMFWMLLNKPEFRERVEELYVQYKDHFDMLDDNVATIKAEIAKSAEMNYLRWDTLGMINPKKLHLTYSETFDEATSSLETWLKTRETNFHVPVTEMATSKVSDDLRTIEIYFEPEEEYEKVRVLVWSMESDPQEVIEIQAELVDGVWYGIGDLTQFKTPGMFSCDVYVNDDTSATVNCLNYVKYIAK